MPDIIIQPGIHISDRSFKYRTSRSSGPGGQNVNKLDTRVELVVDVDGITGLTDAQLSAVRDAMKTRLDSRGRLHFVSQRFRSQGQNRDDVLRMAIEEISAALIPEKERKKTSPGPKAERRRLDEKKKRATKKRQRKPPATDDES